LTITLIERSALEQPGRAAQPREPGSQRYPARLRRASAPVCSKRGLCVGKRAIVSPPLAPGPPKITLHTHRIVRLLEPGAQVRIEVAGRSNRYEVPPPPWTVVNCLNNARTVQPASEGEAGSEAIFQRIQAGEPDPGYTDEPSLLG